MLARNLNRGMAIKDSLSRLPSPTSQIVCPLALPDCFSAFSRFTAGGAQADGGGREVLVSNAFRRSAGSRHSYFILRRVDLPGRLQCLSAFSRFTASRRDGKVGMLRRQSPMPFGVQPVHGIPISSFVESTYPVVSNAFRRSAGSRRGMKIPISSFVESSPMPFGVQPVHGEEETGGEGADPLPSPMPFGVQPVHGRRRSREGGRGNSRSPMPFGVQPVHGLRGPGHRGRLLRGHVSNAFRRSAGSRPGLVQGGGGEDVDVSNAFRRSAGSRPLLDLMEDIQGYPVSNAFRRSAGSRLPGMARRSSVGGPAVSNAFRRSAGSRLRVCKPLIIKGARHE